MYDVLYTERGLEEGKCEEKWIEVLVKGRTAGSVSAGKILLYDGMEFKSPSQASTRKRIG